MKLLSFKSNTVAAVIVGTASKNENSREAFRDRPKNSPPIMVAAAREVPGTTESDWKQPIINALTGLISFVFNMEFFSVINFFSSNIKRIPPIKRLMTVIREFPRRYCLMGLYNTKPVKAVGIKANKMFLYNIKFFQTVFP